MGTETQTQQYNGMLGSLADDPDFDAAPIEHKDGSYTPADLGGNDFDDDEQLPPAVLEIKSIDTVVPEFNDSDIAQDYKFGRNVLYTLISETGDALAGALRVAQASEHPRAYDVVNSLAGTINTLVGSLMGMQKTFKEVTKDTPKKEDPSVTNISQTNNFTMSTSNIIDVVKMAQQKANECTIDMD